MKRVEIPKKINKSLMKMAKLNLITVLNDNVAKPITKFIKNEFADHQRNKIKAEYHFCSNYKCDDKLNEKVNHKVKYIEFSCKEFNPNKPSLREQLKDFTKKHNPSEELVNDLLILMQNNGLNVPRNTNNLFKPFYNFDIINMSVGKYINFGIKKSIINYFNYSQIKNNSKYFHMKTLFMDIAIYVIKSEKVKGMQLPHYMVIMGKICCQFDEPFVIGIYQGTFPTPTIANEILRPFVDEVKDLENVSFKIHSRDYEVSIRAILCDPTSNSLVTCTSLPNSLFGCSKCNQKGQLQFNHGITSFPPTSNLATMRTDEDFEYCLQNGHHVGIPILKELNLELKSQFAIDYKHVVCTGVMKRLMNLWLTGKLDYRLNKESLRKISAELLLMGKNCPREFWKKPRSLDDIEQWDAYDWRQFLLYYAPIVLKNHLPQKYYVHFLYLHLAIRLLLSPENFLECSTYVAGQLLNTFVADYSILYGSHLIDYNVHNLLHFEDVNMKVGPLCDISGFLYEKQLDVILNTIKVDASVSLEDIGAQVVDNTNIIFENRTNELHFDCPYIDESDNSLVFKNVTLTTKDPDNYVITKYGVVVIETICKEEETDEILIVGRQYTNNTVLYQAPVTNQKLLLVSNLSPARPFNIGEILLKGVKIDTSRGTCVIPLVNF